MEIDGEWEREKGQWEKREGKRERDVHRRRFSLCFYVGN